MIHKLKKQIILVIALFGIIGVQKQFMNLNANATKSSLLL
jgi:hypothetical protein